MKEGTMDVYMNRIEREGEQVEREGYGEESRPKKMDRIKIF